MMLPQTQIAVPDWIAAQDLACWFTEAELALSAAWSSEKRRSEWRAGRLAVKRLLRDSFGLDPLDCTVGREGVAPTVTGAMPPQITVSLSHSSGLGAASWSDRETEGTVGVDAQHVRPVHAGLLRRVFTSEERDQIEQRFGAEDNAQGQLLLWAVKEAAIKARRVPWERALRDIAVTLHGTEEAVAHISGEKPMAAQMQWQEGWWLARVVRASPAF